jgi:hypothetical protein
MTMKYRPSPDFLIALGLIAILVTSCHAIVKTATEIKIEQERRLSQADWRPDISHCTDGDPSTDPWDCVRGGHHD